MGISTAIGIGIQFSRGGAGDAWTKETDGLIYKTDFDSISGWINDGSFSSQESQALISFAPLPALFYPSAPGSDDYTGVREATLYREDDILYIIYDGGNNADGWYNHWAQSPDGGLTWTKKGIFGPARVDGDDNPHPALGMGWLCKIGSYYYVYRMTATNVGTGVYIDVAAGDYNGDIWKSSSLSGPWTFIMDNPEFAATWAASEIYPGSLIKVGDVYYYFVGTASATRQHGIYYSSSPEGPWSIVADAILNPTILGDSRSPENPKIFYHPVLEKYCCISNLVDPTNGFTDQNCVQISTSITDWSGATLKRFQAILPLEAIRVIGAPSPVMEAENKLVIGNNNFIPFYYDCDGSIKTAAFHVNRIIRTALLEPSLNALTFDGSASGAIYKAQNNSNFIAEFTAEFPAYTGSESLGFAYRSDGTGDNEYILKVQNGGDKLILIKVIDGTPSTVATGVGTVVTTIGMANRIKVIINGTKHRAFINGELQISVADASLSTGTHIGFTGENVTNGSIRLFSMRGNDIVTISDVPAWTQIDLLADGDIGAYRTYANDQGVATFALEHYPMQSFRVNSVKYDISGGIYGGDSYSFSRITLPAYSGDNLATLFNTVLNDGNTKAYYDSQDLTTITKNVSEQVAAWKDKLGSGNDLVQATDSRKPIWSADGLTFDGVINSDRMQGVFTYNQPAFIYIVFKIITWVDTRVIFDGTLGSSSYTLLQMTEISPQLKAFGAFYSSGKSDLEPGIFGIARILLNGPNSKFIINNNTVWTGHLGANNLGGFTLGSINSGSLNSNICVKAVLLRNANDGSSNKEEILYQGLRSLWL